MKLLIAGMDFQNHNQVGVQLFFVDLCHVLNHLENLVHLFRQTHFHAQKAMPKNLQDSALSLYQMNLLQPKPLLCNHCLLNFLIFYELEKQCQVRLYRFLLLLQFLRQYCQEGTRCLRLQRPLYQTQNKCVHQLGIYHLH